MGGNTKSLKGEIGGQASYYVYLDNVELHEIAKRSR
jgi:hypothetical protein